MCTAGGITGAHFPLFGLIQAIRQGDKAFDNSGGGGAPSQAPMQMQNQMQPAQQPPQQDTSLRAMLLEQMLGLNQNYRGY